MVQHLTASGSVPEVQVEPPSTSRGISIEQLLREIDEQDESLTVYVPAGQPVQGADVPHIMPARS